MLSTQAQLLQNNLGDCTEQLNRCRSAVATLEVQLRDALDALAAYSALPRSPRHGGFRPPSPYPHEALRIVLPHSTPPLRYARANEA